MVNSAGATGPVFEGRVTPPEPPVVRKPVGDNTTVPLAEADMAMLPKCISTVLAMLISEIIVAEAADVAEARIIGAKVNPITPIIIITGFVIFFILFVFILYILFA